MKKFVYLIAILFAGTFAIAVPTDTPVTNVTTTANTTQTNPAVAQTPTQPEYTVESSLHENIYYDKFGKVIARDKTINNQTFFYNKVGQLVGKSITRNENTYYYNQIGNFLGICNETECKDKDFNSTGKIPPLPQIKHFQPVYDNNILNPPPKTSTDEE